MNIIEDNVKIGKGTRVWEYTKIRVSAVIGDNCNIGNHVFIGEGAIIGDNVKIANGVNIYRGTIIKSNVFIGNNVSFTNVRYPRAWRKAKEFETTIVEDNVTIGANAVIMAGIKIGSDSTIGEGAVVVHNVSQGGFVVSPKAECICDREECLECSKRKEKKRIKHLKLINKHA